ncbi:hypothetical protein HPB48_022680 [Haemaphysalis longicornis]|uniref:Uncharacterized protein n=1 Tax=Haemaphysalis longicornis TaxID=44386 RepID=A0A9J6GD31_HAELO|nr:hypothetical protein HPB48_022680 [Haemaphysalis longicornis]
MASRRLHFTAAPSTPEILLTLWLRHGFVINKTTRVAVYAEYESAFDHPGIPDERSKGNDLAEAKTDKGPLDTDDHGGRTPCQHHFEADLIETSEGEARKDYDVHRHSRNTFAAPYQAMSTQQTTSDTALTMPNAPTSNTIPEPSMDEMHVAVDEDEDCSTESAPNSNRWIVVHRRHHAFGSAHQPVNHPKQHHHQSLQNGCGGSDAKRPYAGPPKGPKATYAQDETNETRYLGTEKAVLLRWVGVFVIACGIALAIAALSFLIRFLGSGTLEHAKGLCLTDSCQYQANLIESHVDRNVDPCEDFHAFACSKWTAPAEAYSYDTALMRVQIIKWFNGFHKLLENGAKRYVWATRAERMHKECMSDVDKSAIDKGIGLLKSFMRDRRIPWPGPPIPEVEPLSVLLDLAYNWNLGLWFDARPLRTAVTKGEPLLSLLIDHGAFIGAWSALHYQVVHGGTEAYSRYWNSIQSIFSEGTPLPDVGKSEIQDIATRESMILKALYDAAGSTVMKPARFQIKDVERYTPNISAAVWNRAIEENTVLTGSAAWHRPFDTITAADSAFLGVVNHLSTVFTREEILSHLSWFFAQVFVSLVNRNYLVAKFGDEAIANAQKPFFCATEVEASNELLIVALYTLLHFSAEVRDMIDLRMASVKNAVLEKIDGSMSWADKSSKEVVVAKVQKAETILWPPIEVLEDTALSATYGNVVRTKKSFIERWIDSYNITRTLRWDPRYHEAMKLARNFVLPYFRYDYVLNAVRVSIAALDRPFHVADGTAAMFYGGLGFVYARELVKAFDETGRLVDAEGNIGASWASQSWEEASLAKRDCLQGRSPFPEMPALEAVHSAFKRAVADEHGPQERVMLNYTEEQVFFITACFTLCAVSNSAVRLFSGDCNKAARNYAPFAAAFTCPVGSKMNPERQCPYFD